MLNDRIMVLEALEVGNLELIESYFDENKSIVVSNSVCDYPSPRVHDSLIKYLVSKRDIMYKDLGIDAINVIAISYIRYHLIDSYKIVLRELVSSKNTTYAPLKHLLGKCNGMMLCDDERDFLSYYRYMFTITVNASIDSMTLYDILENFMFLKHDIHSNCIAYITYKVVKDNEDLREISTNNKYKDDMRLLIITCRYGQAPKDLMELLLKYIDDVNVIDDVCSLPSEFPSLFCEDI